MMWPPPAPTDPSPAPAKAAAAAVVEEVKEPNYFNDTLKDAFMYTAGLGSVLGKYLLKNFEEENRKLLYGNKLLQRIY